MFALICGFAHANQQTWQSRDAQLGSGEIDFAREDFDAAKPVQATEHLVFAKDGRFLHRIDHPTRLDSTLESIIFVKGSKWRYTESKGKSGTEVRFDDHGGWPRDDDPKFFLVERPCFPLGAGLSRATLVGSSPTGDELKLSDGTTARVTYTPGGHGVPARLERLWKGSSMSVWDYSGSVPAGQGVWLPKASQMTMSSSGQLKRSFTILSAKLGTDPAASDLTTDWYRPGVSIVDNRVSPMVVWEYSALKKASGKDKNLDPMDLLRLSQQRSTGYANGDKQKVAAASRQSVEGASGIQAMGAIFAVAFVGVFAFVRIRGKSSSAATRRA